MASEHILEVQKQIKFDPLPHTYEFEGQFLTSGTTFISQFHEGFDREKVLDKKGINCPFERTNLKADWDISSPLGTAVHEHLENICRLQQTGMLNYFNKIEHLIRPAYKNQVEKGCILVDNWLNQGFQIVGEEVMITNGTIAGTIDLLMKNPKTNKYVLLDYKTCVNLGKNSYGKMFNEPFEDISCSKHDKYSMQLSLYSAILEDNYDVEVEGMYLLWIPKEGDEFEWRCEDYRDVIRRVL